MPYNSETSQYERRATTVIDATPDGDTVAVAIDVKLDQGIDDYVSDLNHHAENGNHYPKTSVGSDSRFLRQSPAGVVSWADGVPAADAALKDFSNVASGAIAPAKIAQDANNRFSTDAEKATWNGALYTKADVEGVLVDASTTAKGLIELATDAEVQAGTSTSLAVTPAGMKAGQIILGASAPASGVAVDFEGIPSWAKRVTVLFGGVSTNGASPVQIQLGTTSGLENTGYLSAAAYVGALNAAAGSNSTSGILTEASSGAAVIAHGVATIAKLVSNAWVASCVMGRSDSAYAHVGGGSKTLSGTLDRIRVTTVNGTDQFDAGTINLSWE